jgi:hypothetical protein
MVNIRERVIIYEAIAILVVAIVEFFLIQKHGATLRTLITVIGTTVIPAIIAPGVKIWFELQHIRQ